MASVGWVDESAAAAAAPERARARASPLSVVQERLRSQVGKIGEVLCQIDATDGQPSFDLGEVASQSEAQMAQILHSMSAHLNALDKQFHAENNDAVLEGVLEDVEKRLASHKQQASEMLSSALADCQREDAAFLSGILEACVACREEAQHNKGVVGEHGAALACWSTALQESQSICGVLQKDREHQAASQASQHAELCDALDSTGIQTAESLGESLQTLEHMRTAWQSSMEAIRVEVAELKEELRSTASELQTEASQLSAAALQQTTDTGSHIEQRAQQIRCLEEEREHSCLQLQEQERLLRRAAETESALRLQLAEAQADAALHIEATYHKSSREEASKTELTTAHQSEMESLHRVIQELRQQNKEAQAQIRSLRQDEEQHIIDLDQAHESISDLRQAAQHLEERHTALCETASAEASSCREELRALQAYANSQLGHMADDLAARLHHIPGLMEAAVAKADPSLDMPAWESGAASRAQGHKAVDEGYEEAGGPQTDLGYLQEQLETLRADCLEAQQLNDHWHSQYTAQAESSVLAQMQLQQQCNTATRECDELRSQLAAQAASIAEAEQQHTAELEACRETARQDLEARREALEGHWQAKLDKDVNAACERHRQEHESQLMDHANQLSAAHAEEVSAMRDAHLLELQQLQDELDQAQEHHAQQLQEEQQASRLREEALIQALTEGHAIEMNCVVGERMLDALRAIAEAEELAQTCQAEAEAKLTKELEEQAQGYKDQLAAAVASKEEQLAEAHARLQSMSQEWQERCDGLESRLQASEQAVGELKAAHEKTVTRMTAQQARKAAEAEQMQRAAAEMLQHHQQLAALEHDRHISMLHKMQVELQRQGTATAGRERQHEAELASRAADLAVLAQQHEAAQGRAAQGFRAQAAAAAAQHAQQLQQTREATERQVADTEERLQDVKDLLVALQARFNNREARPQDLDTIKALRDAMRQRDEKLEEMQRKLADLDLSRQQLQGEMQLREENWLANGTMRVGPSAAAQDSVQGTRGKARKSSSQPGR